jgi:hypothetical protein
MESSESWRKASKSGNAGCVEVAFGPDGRAVGIVRDSKAPERGHLAVGRETFAALLSDVKAGKLDLA